MMMTPEDKKFVTQRFFLWGSFFVLASSLVAAFLLGGSVGAIRSLFVKTAGASGDTPVVLIGGSLKFQARDTSYPWKMDTPTTYHVSPNYPVQSIVIKAKQVGTSGDDDDPTTDQLRANVSNATSWEVDEFITQQGAPDLQVASLTSLGYEINLTALNGYLCSGGTTISYGQQPGCVDQVVVSKVTLTVTEGDGPQQWGSINCVDSNNNPGKCRIVFRGH